MLMEEHINNRSRSEGHCCWEQAVKDSSSNKLTAIFRMPIPQCRYKAKESSKQIYGPAPVNIRERYPEKWPYAVKRNNKGSSAISVLR